MHVINPIPHNPTERPAQWELNTTGLDGCMEGRKEGWEGRKEGGEKE